MPSISPISFNGQLTRQMVAKYYKPYTGTAETTETTKDEFIRTYDSQIAKIQKHKNFAIQLDEMMHKDPNIQLIISKLPDDVRIEISANFMNESIDTDKEINVGNPMLIASYKPFIDSLKQKKIDFNIFNKLNFELEYNEKGPDKKAIINWLNGLREFFK